MDITDRIQLVISYCLRGSLIFAIGRAAFTEQWLPLFLTVLIFSLTFLPAFISRNYKVFLPIEFDLFAVFFVYASLYLGEVEAFYFRFFWWDSLLHMISALMFGCIGFLIVYILSHQKRLEIRLVPRFVALFSFAFALAIGTLWEILEYSLDHFLDFNMQKSGLDDTMWDLILDTFGALTASFFGYLYLKKGEGFFFDRLLHKFVHDNPKIFQTGESYPDHSSDFRSASSRSSK